MTKPTGRPRGRPKTREYVTLMARVPQELADRVQRYARVHQQPLSVVLRDGLALLLEEDRYRPFLSDMNTASAEQTADMASDSNTGVPGSRTVTPPRARSETLSDTKADAPLPAIMSHTKAETHTGTPQQPPSAPPFDTSKYTLGKLCPRRHMHGTTEQSLLRSSNRHCLACDREKFHERKQAKRQAQPA